MALTKCNCPNCKQLFNIGRPTFYSSLPNTFISLIFGLCPSCEDEFECGDNNTKEKIGSNCRQNIIKDPYLDWSCTTSLALNYHDDFASAIEKGVDLPLPIINGIATGAIKDFYFLPYLIGR